MIEQANTGTLARQPIAPLESESPFGHEPSLRDFLSILRRRKAIAIQTFITVLALGAVITFMTRPSYRSSARILVEGKAQMLAINNPADPLNNFIPPAGHEVSTQVEILRSPTLMEKVCVAVGTTRKNVFVDVRQVGQTDVIEFAATSASRDLAERFTATLPSVYLKNLRSDRLHEVTTALNFARRRYKERNAALDRAERALEKFKTQRGIINSEVEVPADLGALAAARANVRQAEADAASARARYETLGSARRGLSGSVEIPTTMTNPEIAVLKSGLAALESDRKRLLFLYKPDQPEVQRVDVQITDFKQRLARTPPTVTTTTRTTNPAVAESEAKITQARADAMAASANLQELKARVETLRASVKGYNSFSRTQSQLQRDIDSGKSDVANLAKSVNDLSLRQEATEAKNDPIKVIAAAGRASQVSPKVMRNIVLAILLGLLLACGAALLQDSLDDHINDEEETRWLLDTPILGHLPLIPDGQSHLISLKGGDNHLLERFRVLRNNVQFTLVNRSNRLLMVTSTIPAEGKSSTASNLAIAMALDGRRIILVDADLHRPQLDSRFNLARQPGLTNVLADQSTLEDALQDTEIPGLRILTSGVLPPNPAELLNSQAMNELMDALKEDADTVIFDSPPCLATADAQVLSSKVDGVIYVMELGKVRKSAVQRSFELLHQAHAHVLGVVFNKIESAHGDRYYSYDYGYYGEDKSSKKESKSAGALGNADSKTLSARRASANGTGSTNGSNDGSNGAGSSADVEALTQNKDV